MTKKKKPEPNPIEEAIGDRAKPKTEAEKILQAPAEVVKEILSQIPETPSPQEMITLEELNRQTEERLQDQYPEEPPRIKLTSGKTIPPVLQPDPQPVTKTSSPESPPQKKVDMAALARHINDPSKECPDCGKCNSDDSQKIERKLVLHQAETAAVKGGRQFREIVNKAMEESLPDIPEKVERVFPCKVEHKIEEIDEYQDAEKKPQFELKEEISIRGCSINTPAEDIELTALRKYILEDGFVVATVAFHIVSLCAQPMTTPSTTMWDFKDRAMIPDMVLALLNQPGYIEGIWPSLKIVMGSNKGNSAWSAGIATTIAFFDVIRTLPTIEELKNDTEKKS